MKRNGFTLAEVLIALAIVGIVTAMTIPNLVASYKKDVWESARSTAVSNLETALQSSIYKENVNSLSETKAWKTENFANIGLAHTKYSDGTITMKNGIEYKITKNTKSSKNEEDIYAAGGNLVEVAGEVTIDVNGSGDKPNSKPNEKGKDQFKYVISGDGYLYPEDSNDVKIYYNN